ncbi:tumor necrosis factor ligand superfamily member 6 isoform X2 [Brienomyrus brachyistius]|nr:tumor necrosis factor ligand superfamily member 6 isoform X2 [Brienomyrus brachyistius]XP_048833092.1 tumor necrosis factor ligand superfamily member 6 isoform X2 [Brienomyrus brachyistius]
MANLDYDRRCMYPPVFLVDRGGLAPAPAMPRDPGLVPCWTFPPARAKSKRGHGQSCLVLIGLLSLLLLFAAIALGAYQILRLQSELAQLKQDFNTENKGAVSEKLTGLPEIDSHDEGLKQAAHLTFQLPKNNQATLEWEPQHGRAFTQGVVYRDGGLQVKEAALYFVYSRVEYIARQCPDKDALVHVVFKRSQKDPKPLVLLEGHREGYCQLQRADYWSTSSYVGAVLHLDQHDQIFVNVSKPGLLSHNFDANFFGLFKI